jgi:hypothetical protein
MQAVREYIHFNYSSTIASALGNVDLSSGRTSSTSITLCAATTRYPAARALRQPCRAPRVLVSRPQRLYIDYAVRRRDVVFWAYDYLDDLPRLVSTRKLVEDGSHDINN